MEIQKRTTLKLAIDETMEILNRLYFTNKIAVGGKTVTLPENITFEIDLEANKNEGELEFEFSWSKGKKKISPLVLFMIHTLKDRIKLKGIETIFKRIGISYKIQTLSPKLNSRQLRISLMKELNHGIELFIADDILSVKLNENLREFITKPILSLSYKLEGRKTITMMAAYILGIKYTEIAEAYKKYSLTRRRN
ncbi:MAG: amphi-Trp domain-containing protein [Bacteroidota bacterium]|nr:amphi-Trp domain-containing protein [Bacteroidota bacterium]